MEMNPELTELDFMQECYIRDLYKNDDYMIRRYNYLLSGFEGEKIMYDWLLQNLPAHAVILHDTWMEYRGITQIDLLVLLNNIIWVIEVKHYNGYFKYEDNVCTLNGHRMSNDQIAQMRNRILIMKDVIEKSGQEIQLKGSMIFTHQNSEISVPPEKTFNTMTLNQINRYLHEEIFPNINRNKQHILPHLLKFRTNSTFTMPTLNGKDMHFIKKGVYCPHCYSFKMRVSDRNLVCQECDYQEYKEKTMLRQYCCQGVLYHETNLITSREIYNLSEKSFTIRNLRKVLKGKIQYTFKGNRLCFYNHALPYSKYMKEVNKE